MVHQRSSNKRKKSFTFMIVPHNSAQRIWKLQLPEWLSNIFFGFLIIVAMLIVLSLLYSSRLTAKLIHYYGLLAENHRQAGQIEYFLKETERLKQDIDQLEEKDQRLREMLGLPRRATPQQGLPLNNSRSEVVIQKRLALLKQDVTKLKNKQYDLQAVAQWKGLRFAYTPSLWPIQGNIQSKFGWRIHPFLRRPEIHKGIDIPAWYGAPIRATAQGKVIYSDFAKGYGYAIVLDHGHGIQTIYGHNSQLLAQVGDIVAKGQVIASAGRTGWATGVHCHYEIRKYNIAVNPIAYLDLNIRTASSLW
ncbi:MAG: M23 family metallopeptidase [Candidatus Margulisbacteria bacterium]|nr:M23 family metallopeptidase [Candidatus Margulisiibacteriota bacterium]